MPERVIYIFYDGIGFGLKNTNVNPFTLFGRDFFGVLGGKRFDPFGLPFELIETDAHMSISGLPQSATGQTALFTGFNAPKILGRHITGFPTYTLRPYLLEKSLFSRLKQVGKKAVLINAYSQSYLDRIKEPRNQRLMSASTILQKSLGEPFFTLEDYKNKKALYMDMTNWFLRSKGHPFPLKPAEEGGRDLVELSKKYDLTLYEYFFTDRVGHAQSLLQASCIINHMEKFMQGLLEKFNPQKNLLIITSDHGNLEDLSTPHHSHHKVPTYLLGCGAQKIAPKIKFLYDIPRQILDLLAPNHSFNFT